MLVKAAKAMQSLIDNGIEWKICDLTKISVNHSKNRKQTVYIAIRVLRVVGTSKPIEILLALRLL
jgi:hypothetical protein